MGRRSNGMGCLVFKGEGRPWLARWSWRGEIYTKSTGETSREKALKVLEKLTRPYREDSTLETLRVMESRIRAQEDRSFNAKSVKVSELSRKVQSSVEWADFAENTRRGYLRMLGVFSDWLSERGVELMKNVGEGVAGEFLEGLSKRAGVHTWNSYVVYLSHVWDLYGREGGCPSNPWRKFRRRKVPLESSREAFTDGEVAALLEGTRGDVQARVLFGLGAFCGMRCGDCAVVKWSQIDRERKVVRVVPMKTRKYMSSPLEIPIHPSLEAILEDAWRGRDASSEYVCPRMADMYRRRTLGGFVRRVMQRCGVGEFRENERGRKVNTRSFHGLRHYFVSRMVELGVSPFVLHRLVGHQSYTMTLHYFHANMASMRAGIEKLPALVAQEA